MMKTSRPTVLALGALAAWVTIVIVLAAGDNLATSTYLPWRVIVVTVAPILVFVALFQVKAVRTYLLGFDPRLVLAVQFWRVLGVAFLFGWTLDDLDAGFALPAGIGDVATGVAALFALAALLNGRLTKQRLVAFTALGIGDFVVAVAVGAFIVRPESLEQLRWVLFPTLAVPFFAMAHTVTWFQLRAGPPTRTV